MHRISCVIPFSHFPTSLSFTSSLTEHVRFDYPVHFVYPCSILFALHGAHELSLPLIPAPRHHLGVLGTVALALTGLTLGAHPNAVELRHNGLHNTRRAYRQYYEMCARKSLESKVSSLESWDMRLHTGNPRVSC